MARQKNCTREGRGTQATAHKNQRVRYSQTLHAFLRRVITQTSPPFFLLTITITVFR